MVAKSELSMQISVESDTEGISYGVCLANHIPHKRKSDSLQLVERGCTMTTHFSSLDLYNYHKSPLFPCENVQCTLSGCLET